ncbi:MAG TPA: hypothetical protein PKC76_00600 [Saprospiraceae bacterium]|nr:hypothetical protein [Saprospiraceae bacterium]HMP22591.1 hypothetical protein [Saprospiraceae bacterium]
MIAKTENRIRRLTLRQFPYTNIVGIGRSLLALGTLLTLLFNDISILVPMADGEILNPLLSSPIRINSYNFYLLLGIEHIYIMKAVAVLILLLVISGFYPQITCFLHWWVSVSFLLFSSAIDGGDQITANLTLLLIPLCLTDPRRNHWLRVERKERIWSLFGIFAIWGIRLQVAAIYFHAAVGKLPVEEWTNGTALYYWFYHSTFGMPPWLEYIMYPLLSNFFFVTVATFSVIILELILMLGLTMNVRQRLRLLPVALSFHFAIILFHGIFSFFFAIAAGLILYLYPVYKHFTFKTPKLRYAKSESHQHQPVSDYHNPVYTGEPIRLDH